jgi:hypothetical protein
MAPFLNLKKPEVELVVEDDSRCGLVDGDVFVDPSTGIVIF